MNCLDDHVRILLIDGLVYSHDRDGDQLAFPTMAELESVWAKVGGQLTADFIDTTPGQRPWGWWQWSRPTALPRPAFTWNLTDARRMGAVAFRNRERPSEFWQREYLASHGLLTTEEQAALAADDASWAGIGDKAIHAGTSPAQPAA